MAPKPLFSLLFVFLLLLISPPLSSSHPFATLHTLHSLSHSLLLRVAALRSSRGDTAGSARARLLAANLHRATGLSFWLSAARLGWDYLWNYAWRDAASLELAAAVGDLNELLRSLSELTRMSSQAERAEWVARNYRSALRASNSLFRRLLKVFHQSGPLRQLVETVQKEVVAGDLLRDCLELGSNDLNSLVQIMKDVALQFSSNSESDL